MARFVIHIIFVFVLISALAMADFRPSRSDSSSARRAGPQAFDASYRSRSSSHKVIVYDEQLRDQIIARGGAVIEDYGAFILLSAPAEDVASLSAEPAPEISVRDDMNVILLRAGAFDTTDAAQVSSQISSDLARREYRPFKLNSSGGIEQTDKQLYIVQAVGPIKREWIDELRAAAEIISYIPNNAYLIRADDAGLDKIESRASLPGSFIQWSGVFRPDYKIAPEFSATQNREVTATIQFVAGEYTRGQIEGLAAAFGASILSKPVDVLNYTNAQVRINADKLADIARLSDVVWIEPWAEPQMFDERQGHIIASNFTGNQLSPPGYLSWLRSKGLAVTPDFVVDLADSGIDRGILDPEVLHPDFLNPAGLARIAYARFFSAAGDDGSPNDIGGHGTINASILGGYNVKPGFPFTDPEGYSYGLGIHPFAKLGISKMFDPAFTNPNLAAMVDAMYRDGARISSNSWGANINAYTANSQLYDSLVRDARRGEPGNQELTVIFAAGNQGAGNMGSPATAKNIIAVGASENLRPSGLDGCGINQLGADDIQSIIKFSSQGPVSDGRIKPDIMAPGTHIQGARSQDAGFIGSGICGPKDWPAGQSLYTWSSGTSHSAPAVAGVAALVRQFFQQSSGHAPSPAMMKAYLTNSATYMTGELAGGNLPGNNQGWGLVNLSRALDDVPRVQIDQTQTLSASGQTFTLSGRIASATKPFRVTLAWTDAPGPTFGNPSVNDLDLQVTVGGKTYVGNRFNGSASIEGGAADKLNNLEGVWLPAGITGDFTVRIIAANIAGDGLPGNSDTSDQDFALVVYNAQPPGGGSGGGSGGGGSGGGGGGGGGNPPVDSPPTVNLRFPLGGEKLTVGNFTRILWDAADDKAIQSQRVEFSSDGGQTYNLIATLDGKARSFDWKIPALPTPAGRIRVSALDGVNLAVSSSSPGNFTIVNGPPDTTPPTVTLLSPNGDTIIGSGLTTTIKWKEADNVGVIKRVLELSSDGGQTFQPIITLVAPGSGEQQSYDWQPPASLSTGKGKMRITVFDGAGNSASMISSDRFDIWAMPIITDVEYNINPSGKDEFEITGRNFQIGDTEIYVAGVRLKKVQYDSKFDTGTGTTKKVFSKDKKIDKRVPAGKWVDVVIVFPRSGQASPPFQFKRKRSQTS